jgi:hypothetical protein
MQEKNKNKDNPSIKLELTPHLIMTLSYSVDTQWGYCLEGKFSESSYQFTTSEGAMDAGLRGAFNGSRLRLEDANREVEVFLDIIGAVSQLTRV